MSMWSDFFDDHAYEIMHEGQDPTELYWKKILGVNNIKDTTKSKRSDGYFTINNKIKEKRNGSLFGNQ